MSIPIALQLYTVRDQMEKDLEGTLAQVAKIGYKNVEFAGLFGRSASDVRKIIDWNLEYFRTKGVSGNGSGPVTEGPVVVGGAETVDYVLARAVSEGVDYTAPQVHAVLDAQMSYLEAIGAIGPEAPPEERPGP